MNSEKTPKSKGKTPSPSPTASSPTTDKGDWKMKPPKPGSATKKVKKNKPASLMVDRNDIKSDTTPRKQNKHVSKTPNPRSRNNRLSPSDAGGRMYKSKTPVGDGRSHRKPLRYKKAFTPGYRGNHDFGVRAGPNIPEIWMPSDPEVEPYVGKDTFEDNRTTYTREALLAARSRHAAIPSGLKAHLAELCCWAGPRGSSWNLKPIPQLYVSKDSIAAVDFLDLIVSDENNKDREISIKDLQELFQQGGEVTLSSLKKFKNGKSASAGGTPGQVTPKNRSTTALGISPRDPSRRAQRDFTMSDGELDVEERMAGLQIVGIGYGVIDSANLVQSEEPDNEEIIEISMGGSYGEPDDDYEGFDPHEVQNDAAEDGDDEDAQYSARTTPGASPMGKGKGATPVQSPKKNQSPRKSPTGEATGEVVPDFEEDDNSELGKLRRECKAAEVRIEKLNREMAEVARARRQDVSSIKEAFQELNSDLNVKLRKVVEDNSEVLARLNTVARTNLKLQERLKRIGEKNMNVYQLLNTLREKRGLPNQEVDLNEGLTDIDDILGDAEEVTITMIEQDYAAHKKMLVDLVNCGVYDGITFQRQKRKKGKTAPGGSETDGGEVTDLGDDEPTATAGEETDHDEAKADAPAVGAGESAKASAKNLPTSDAPAVDGKAPTALEGEAVGQQANVDRLMATLGLAGVAGNADGTGGNNLNTDAAVEQLLKSDLVEMAKTFYGSRCIQNHLEHNTPGFFKAFLEQIQQGRVFELMTDKFGRFAFGMVLNKLNDEQKEKVLESLLPRIVDAACDNHGSFGTQVLIKSLTLEKHLYLVADALQESILTLISNYKGHYLAVVLISQFPYEIFKFIDDAIILNVMNVATDNQGLQVIKAIFQYRTPQQIAPVMKAISSLALSIVEDQYGNYVIQQCLGAPSAPLDAPPPTHINEAEMCLYENRRSKQRIMKSMIGSFRRLSQLKFSSNVVERGLQGLGSAHWIAIIIDELLAEPQSVVKTLVSDRFGNYVLQTALAVADDIQVQLLADKIAPHLPSFRPNLKSKWIKLLKKAKQRKASKQQHAPMQYMPEHMANGGPNMGQPIPMAGPPMRRDGPMGRVERNGPPRGNQMMMQGGPPTQGGPPPGGVPMSGPRGFPMQPPMMPPSGVPPHLQHTYQLHHMPHPHMQMMMPPQGQGHPMYQHPPHMPPPHMQPMPYYPQQQMGPPPPYPMYPGPYGQPPPHFAQGPQGPQGMVPQQFQGQQMQGGPGQQQPQQGPGQQQQGPGQQQPPFDQQQGQEVPPQQPQGSVQVVQVGQTTTQPETTAEPPAKTVTEPKETSEVAPAAKAAVAEAPAKLPAPASEQEPEAEQVDRKKKKRSRGPRKRGKAKAEARAAKAASS